jgi:hypothetical protein
LKQITEVIERHIKQTRGAPRGQLAGGQSLANYDHELLRKQGRRLKLAFTSVVVQRGGGD